MKKPELIAPAGDLEKLKIAFQYGADAVYASTPLFSMRTREINFDYETLAEGIKYTHGLGKKIYLTLNTFPHSSEIEGFKKYALKIISLKPDAIIAADPGAINFVRKNSDIPIHLSTQANTTNQLSAEFWKEQGIKRIVLARELSLKDIEIISKNCRIELESFVHGAMCMAYSGRCQISNYLTGRDPNKGACVQACRFKYRMYGIEEDLRKGEIFPIYEDDNGSYILNSKDLCMIEHLPEMLEAGISSFKIEGRLKSIYYVGIVTRAYRKAIDSFFENKEKYQKEKDLLKDELSKTSNRGFTTGFYFEKPNQSTNNYETSRAKSNWNFIGLIKKYDKKAKLATVEVKNYLPKGVEAEIVTSDKIISYNIEKMLQKDKEIDLAHAGYLIELPINEKIPDNSFVRIKNNL